MLPRSLEQMRWGWAMSPGCVEVTPSQESHTCLGIHSMSVSFRGSGCRFGLFVLGQSLTGTSFPWSSSVAEPKLPLTALQVDLAGIQGEYRIFRPPDDREGPCHSDTTKPQLAACESSHGGSPAVPSSVVLQPLHRAAVPRPPATLARSDCCPFVTSAHKTHR